MCFMQHTRTHAHAHSVICIRYMHVILTMCSMQHTRTRRHIHTHTHTCVHRACRLTDQPLRLNKDWMAESNIAAKV